MSYNVAVNKNDARKRYPYLPARSARMLVAVIRPLAKMRIRKAKTGTRTVVRAAATKWIACGCHAYTTASGLRGRISHLPAFGTNTFLWSFC